MTNRRQHGQLHRHHPDVHLSSAQLLPLHLLRIVVHSANILTCCSSHLALLSLCRYVLRITTHGKAKVPLNPQRVVSSLLRAKPVAQSAPGNLAPIAV